MTAQILTRDFVIGLRIRRESMAGKPRAGQAASSMRITRPRICGHFAGEHQAVFVCRQLQTQISAKASAASAAEMTRCRYGSPAWTRVSRLEREHSGVIFDIGWRIKFQRRTIHVKQIIGSGLTSRSKPPHCGAGRNRAHDGRRDEQPRGRLGFKVDAERPKLGCQICIIF